VLASVVSAYYYLRIIKVMYFDEPGIEPLDGPLPVTITAVLTISSAFIVLFMAFSSPVVAAAEAAAKTLF